MLLWGPPFVEPKNKRFRHGFKKNLDENMIFPFLFYCVKFGGAHHQKNCMPPETIEKLLAPWVLCLLARPGIFHSAIFQKDSFSLATTLVVQTSSMLIRYHVTVARSCRTLM